MLRIEKISTGYNKKPVLTDVSLEVNQGEIVGLIGPNGAGKSTVLKAVSGLLPLWKGEIQWKGDRINGNSPAKNIGLGLTFCPQGNRVFDRMTVKENLEVGGFRLSREEFSRREGIVLELFPKLKGRLKEDAGNLSGGERQMLAIARALVPETKLLLLDEPSLGLAPNLLGDVFGKLTEINRELGLAMLVVEQKVTEVLGICHRVVGLKLGRVGLECLPGEVGADPGVLRGLFL
jgi:branched-chain amino acid transport system ATP-binding protein